MNTPKFARFCALFAVCAGMVSAALAENAWTYDESANTVTDGKWVIAVTAYDSDAGTMTLGAITTAADDGVLDLRDMVVGETAITGLSLPTDVSSKKGTWAGAAITKLYVNHVAGTSVPGAMQGNTTVQEIEFASDTITTINSDKSSFKYCTSLKRCVLDCPNLVKWDYSYGSGSPFASSPVTNKFHEIVNPWVTTLVGNSLFTGLSATKGPVVLTNLSASSSSPFSTGGTTTWSGLTDIWVKWPGKGGITFQTTFPAVTNLVLEMPNMRSTGQIRGFSVKQDVASVVPPYVQNISDYAALRGMPNLYGCLTLTNLTSMAGSANNAWLGYAFLDCGGVKSAEFRGPITNIPYKVMSSAVTNLVLQLPNVTNVCKGAFLMANKGTISLYGAPWAENLRTNLLERLDGNKAGSLTLKVSKKQGWREYAQEFGDDFPKAEAPEGCFGVWRETNGTGTRGAWMVHLPQDDDPRQGMCIVIR